MNRTEFFGKLAGFDEVRLQKALWNLYWRGSAQMRERIEAELDPAERDRQKRAAQPVVDPETVLREVRDFVDLARAGSYMAGDRRVSPRERTRWRFTLQRLVKESQQALQAEDIAPGATAVELLVDLACEMSMYDYFRSEDSVAAARFVVSDVVALLWARLRDVYGFAGFAERAAPQLLRWESRHGWTRIGDGPVRERETTLAEVLARTLSAPDMWTGFAEAYLRALDGVAAASSGSGNRRRRGGWNAAERSGQLAEWNSLLATKLAGSDTDDVLERLTRRPALRSS